ncbi:amino acid racemase [Candidatus Gracilibacteria bacterium]|nr:amino acid racemase [Candidatus Gracilibacteria bacterium]
MKPQQLKTIGIIGGMGPHASADLYKKIIAICQKKHNAVQDSDFPCIWLLNLPAEDFDETGVVESTSVQNQLLQAVQKLESLGCDVIIMACNTIHMFWETLRNHTHVPILHIVQETLKQVKQKEMTTVGLLCTETTHKQALYHAPLSKENVHILACNHEERKHLTQIIKNIMSGRHEKSDKEFLEQKAKDFVSQGAEAIILGCTELPIIFPKKEFLCFDSTQILAEAAVDFSFQN